MMENNTLMENGALTNVGKRTTAPLSKATWILIVTLLSGLLLYYLWTRGWMFFNYKREVYTDYFWPHAPWLLAHVILGSIAALIGPFQFIPKLRVKYPSLHRSVGKTYLGCVFISTFVSFYLVSHSQFGLPYAVGLAMLGVVWSVSSGMAYISIRRGNILLHREWMIKSYVLTFSFVFFRFFEDLLIMMDISSFHDRKVLMTWACWAIPLFVTEVVLQYRKLKSPSRIHTSEVKVNKLEQRKPDSKKLNNAHVMNAMVDD